MKSLFFNLSSALNCSKHEEEKLIEIRITFNNQITIPLRGKQSCFCINRLRRLLKNGSENWHKEMNLSVSWPKLEIRPSQPFKGMVSPFQHNCQIRKSNSRILRVMLENLVTSPLRRKSKSWKHRTAIWDLWLNKCGRTWRTLAMKLLQGPHRRWGNEEMVKRGPLCHWLKVMEERKLTSCDWLYFCV